MPVQQQEAKTESHVVNLLLLHLTAGMLDGVSYLRSHVFTANMTGNLVLIGIHATQGKAAPSFRELDALVAFAVGALIAALLMLKREDRGENAMPIGFGAELCLLVAFAVLFWLRSPGNQFFIDRALIVTAAMGLAVQSVTVRRLRISGVVSTFISGTITTSMVGIARLIHRSSPPEQRSEEEDIGLLFGMLAVYLGGVVLSAFFNSRLPWIPATAPAAIVAIVFWRARRRAA